MTILACIAAAALTQAAPAQAPVFKAGVEIVRLDVTVTGADGLPIKDLRQEEVEVIDGGERLPVILFQHVRETGESFADVASRTTAGEVSTNQGAARGQLYVIVFDQLHIAPGNEQRARIAAQRFVSTLLHPGDRVALYALPGPGPQIPFTADTRRVGRALLEVHGTAEKEAYGTFGSMTLHEAFEIVRGNERILQRVADRVQAQGLSDTLRRASISELSIGTMPLTELVKEDARKIAATADGQTRAILAGLADVLRPLAAIEGRKTVILISEGFQSDSLRHEVDLVAAAAAQSSSIIYAFDINSHVIDASAAEPVGPDQAADIQDRLSPLGTLAAETGGSLVLDVTARPDRAFADLASASHDYYLVGFAPGAKAIEQRGEYRRVAVRVRRSGARVSTRTGFTLADASLHLDRHQAIERAMAAPFPQQGVPIQYTTYVLRGSAPGLQSVVLAVEAQLPIAPPQDRRAADVVFAVRSVKDGRVAASGRDVMSLPSSADPHATEGTGRFKVQFEAPPGDYLMRLVVREPGGLLGSADRHFTVRALDGPSVAATDLLIGARAAALSVHPDAYTGDGFSGVFEVYARTATQLKDARAVVDLMPLGEAASVVSGQADLGELRETQRGVSREGRVDLPIESVAPGVYLARVRVLAGPDTLTEVVRQVDVRHGRRPQEPDTSDQSAQFDPRDVASGAVAKNFAAQLAQSGSPGGADGRTALDRLAAADYPAAIAAFESLLRADAGNASAAFLLGWAYHGAGEDRLAISAWRRAAFIKPDLVPAHLALADIFSRLMQPDLARQAIRTGLAAVPQSPELLDRLARLEKQ